MKNIASMTIGDHAFVVIFSVWLAYMADQIIDGVKLIVASRKDNA